MAVEFQNTDKGFAASLNDVAANLQAEKITLRHLLTLIGEQGLLLFCMILVVPFLLPISIPGVSTVFGAVIILIGIGVTLNRVPWLPNRLMERTFKTEDLKPVMQKGAELFARIERFIRPRLMMLTNNIAINRLNGLMLTFGGVLLIFPFGLIPFSNTLPGYAILFLAAGMLQRDGIFIVLGYILNIATVFYFGALFAAAVAAGQGISALLGS
jgi:hypothetical protein